jgi:N-acetylneuraminate synthase
MSTGMNSIQSIRTSVEILRDYKIPYALLHCTNLYPTPDKLIRLGSIGELQDAFPDAVLGLSDHSTTNYPCIGAVALGASILERHFTDTKNRKGPDIICSMDEIELSELIKASKAVHRASGGNKIPCESEGITMAFAFASVVSTRDIEVGELLSKENIWVMRPHGGDFGPSDLENLYGREVTSPIKARHQIKSTQIN